jgi:tRNA(Ile)-lysidine synthase
MPSKKNVEELFRQVKLIKKDTSLNLKISNDRSIRAFGNKLFIVSMKNNLPSYRFKWAGQDEIELPNKSKLHFVKTKKGGLSLSKLGVNTLDIKGRTGGEKLKPLPDQPSRSLKYLFQKADIPHWERDQFPLVYANEKLVAVPNLGVQFEYQSKIGEVGYQIKWLRD